MMSLTLEAVEQLLNARLVRNWRIRIGFLPRGLGWVLPAQAMHVKQFLGGLIIGLKIAVFQRPGRRNAVRMTDFAKITFPKPE